SRSQVEALARRDQELAGLVLAIARHRQQIGSPAALVGLASSAFVTPVAMGLAFETRQRSTATWEEAAAADSRASQLRRALPALPRGYFLHEPSARPPATRLLIRGKASRPGPQVAPGMPAVLVSAQPSFPSPGPRSSLRRLTLASWIASPDNPLTARVLVNRVW